MKACVFRTTLRLQVIAVAGAIGLTAPASGALAQGAQGQKAESSAAAPKPGSVKGVVVKPAPKPKVPPHKKAAYDAEVAKRQAQASYRGATPTATVPPTATATATGTAPPPSAVRAENYPGLRSQVGQ